MDDSLLDHLILTATKEDTGAKSVVHKGDTDSSDDEDNRDFENRLYNECGREMKQLLNNTKVDCTPAAKPKFSWKAKTNTTSKGEFIFDIRVINPLVSCNLLESRVCGREVISMRRLKLFVQNIPADKDWIIAGVIVSKSATKVSQKGKNYCIWTLSDLKVELKTISVFLFGNAYKELWKTVSGTVVAILNPSVLDRSDNSKNEANLSVNNHQLVMIIGQSKDLGTCKSVKKNGERCTAFVNLSVCEFCVYHVKQEYKKCSKRSDLQSSYSGRGLTALRNKVLGKDQVFYAGKLYSAISTGTNKKQQDLLPKLTKQTVKNQMLLKSLNESLSNTEHTGKHNKSAQLQQLETKPPDSVLKNQPKLDFSTSQIDLSAPIQRKEIMRAKQSAVAWVQKNGTIKKQDPNNTRGTGKARKRLTESTENDILDPKRRKIQENAFFSDRFKKIMAATSQHTDLLEQFDDEEQEKYFKKLEMKERMEEKMLSTYKVACKAVKCLKCKYTSFSASDMCKAERHPLKIFEAIKRFFKCSNCGNRMVCLTVVPMSACKNCKNNTWERTSMMKEKKVDIAAPKLSIRGGEQKFINSDIIDCNLDLLVAAD